jgi:hypothetical protein
MSLVKACRALISACEQGADPKTAIEMETGWARFVTSVNLTGDYSWAIEEFGDGGMRPLYRPVSLLAA